MTTTNNERVEAFLEHCEINSKKAFNVQALEDWLNATYAPMVFTRGECSKMLQRYSWANQRRLPKINEDGTEGTWRPDAFVPAYTIDVTKRGGPNAMWFISDSEHDLGESMRRTASDAVKTNALRYATRVAPEATNHPHVLAYIENLGKQTETAYEGLEILMKTLP